MEVAKNSKNFGQYGTIFVKANKNRIPDIARGKSSKVLFQDNTGVKQSHIAFSGFLISHKC